MLYLATRALVDLLFPLQWTGVLIPVLPARLIQALEAPCPYIVGIERRYEKVELPSDDFVMVDLDSDMIESTVRPTPLPRHQRRKLLSLLQLAAPHHSRYGVPTGPPAYAIETYPYDSFVSENASIFTSRAQSTQLAKYAGINSSAFGQSSTPPNTSTPLIYNAFLHARDEQAPSRGYSARPGTSSTSKTGSPPSPRESSPTSGHFPPMPHYPSRNESGSTLQASLREKRSGHFDAASRRSSSFGLHGVARRPSAPFLGHAPNPSVSTLNTEHHAGSTYTPSVYAQSTVAASTIVPQASPQPIQNSEGTLWVEGHCLQVQPMDDKAVCAVCDERAEEGMYKCSGCKTVVHNRCAGQVCLVCPVAFHPDQVRAAFVRCFASLFYTYRKHFQPASGDKKKAGVFYNFNGDAFLKSLPHEHAEYIAVLQQTQSESLHLPYCHQLTRQVSTSSSVSASGRTPSPRIRGPFCLTRSSSRSVTAAARRSSLAGTCQISSLIPRTICGGRQVPHPLRRAVAASRICRGIILGLSPEVGLYLSFHSITLTIFQRRPSSTRV